MLLIFLKGRTGWASTLVLVYVPSNDSNSQAKTGKLPAVDEDLGMQELWSLKIDC